MNNSTYVPAEDLVKALHLNGAWSDDKTTFMIGDTGVDMMLVAGSTSVSQGDQTVSLSAPPIISNQKLYITVQDAMRLFGDIANLKTGEARDGLAIYPAEQKQIQSENDPNFTMDSVHAATIRSSSSVAQKIIATGERYMGVPYRFAAKTGDTRSFDCSSFVQTIYRMHGIQLPRLAGQQGHAGVYVARNNLKPGDLVFFYSPPHQHVAIYIGNGKILHTYGNPGVTISNFNSGWWNNHFTKARRVI
jgi:cell wall-associated NlpC family hydrolase